MIYRRPQDFDSAVRLLEACTRLKVDGQQKALQDAVRRLFDLDWYNDAMRPLYESNVVVQMVMNSLVPTIQELIIEDGVFEKHARAADEAKSSRYGDEFDAMRRKMLTVAPTRKQREVTPEFEAMAAAMERYANDETVQSALRGIFCTMKTARTAFRLVFGRINLALEQHCQIEKSDDVPLEALSL